MCIYISCRYVDIYIYQKYIYISYLYVHISYVYVYIYIIFVCTYIIFIYIYIIYCILYIYHILYIYIYISYLYIYIYQIYIYISHIYICIIFKYNYIYIYVYLYHIYIYMCVCVPGAAAGQELSVCRILFVDCCLLCRRRSENHDSGSLSEHNSVRICTAEWTYLSPRGRARDVRVPRAARSFRLLNSQGVAANDYDWEQC